MKPKLLFLFTDGWDDAAFAGAEALRAGGRVRESSRPR
jgi:hypothetical protein